MSTAIGNIVTNYKGPVNRRELIGTLCDFATKAGISIVTSSAVVKWMNHLTEYYVDNLADTYDSMYQLNMDANKAFMVYAHWFQGGNNYVLEELAKWVQKHFDPITLAFSVDSDISSSISETSEFNTNLSELSDTSIAILAKIAPRTLYNSVNRNNATYSWENTIGAGTSLYATYDATYRILHRIDYCTAYLARQGIYAHNMDVTVIEALYDAVPVNVKRVMGTSPANIEQKAVLLHMFVSAKALLLSTIKDVGITNHLQLISRASLLPSPVREFLNEPTSKAWFALVCATSKELVNICGEDIYQQYAGVIAEDLDPREVLLKKIKSVINDKGLLDIELHKVAAKDPTVISMYDYSCWLDKCECAAPHATCVEVGAVTQDQKAYVTIMMEEFNRKK